MDIHSKGSYPASALSNFKDYDFVFEGVECKSMEGFLQSLKFKDPDEQIEVCKLVGFEAKKKGEETQNEWKIIQELYWQRRTYKRSSNEYQKLLDCVYCALAKNVYFRKALIDSGEEDLTHSIGGKKQVDTILTEYELCARLKFIRNILLYCI